MSDKKLFSHPRWNDIPKPRVIGCVECTPEEKEESRKRFREHLRKIGVKESNYKIN